MKKHPFTSLLLAISLLLAAGCSTPTAPAASPTDMPEISTPTAESPSPSPTPDLSRLTIECVDIVEAYPENIKLKGVLVVNPIGEDAYLWDLLADNKFIDNAVHSSVVSPDRSMLAFIDLALDSLIIMDSAGNRLDEVPNWGRGYYLLHWLDDNQMVIRFSYSDSPHESDAITVLELSNNERRDILPEFPDITDHIRDVNWGTYTVSPLVVNSQLSRLLYPSLIKNDTSLIIWNLQTNQEAGRIHHHVYEGAGVNSSAPAWSRDGTTFVTSAMLRYVFDPDMQANPVQPLEYAGDASENVYINVDDEFPYTFGYELILVNEVGKAQRLSYLTTNYYAIQSDWTWSPDETHIAFWLTIKDEEHPINQELAVLDVESGEVTNYCISGISSPIWSPDGSQILIHQDPADQTNYQIVDLDAGVAFSISEEDDVMVNGWLISPP